MNLTSRCNSRFGLRVDIEPDEALDLRYLVGKVNQGIIDSACQVRELREVLIVCRAPLATYLSTPIAWAVIAALRVKRRSNMFAIISTAWV